LDDKTQRLWALFLFVQMGRVTFFLAHRCWGCFLRGLPRIVGVANP
jgi:hypothetical protein